MAGASGRDYNASDYVLTMLLVAFFLGCFWAWQSMIVNFQTFDRGISLVPLWYVSNITALVAYFVCSVRAVWVARLCLTKRYLVIAAALLCIGGMSKIASGWIPALDLVPEVVWYIATSASITAGTTLLTLSVYSMLILLTKGCGQKARTRFVVIFGGSAVCLMLCLLVGSLSRVLAAVLLAAAPFALLVACIWSNMAPWLRGLAENPAICECASGQGDGQGLASGNIWTLRRLCLVVFTFGISLNFVRAITAFKSQGHVLGDPDVTALTVVLFAAALVPYLVQRGRRCDRLPFFMLTVLVTMTLFVDIAGFGGTVLASALASSSFFFFVATLYCALMRIFENDACPVRPISFVYVAYIMGLALGTLLSRVVMMLPDSVGLAVPLGIAYTVFIAGYVLAVRFESGGWARKDEVVVSRADAPGADDDYEGALRLRCTALSQDKGLTAREFDVFCQLARGHNLKAIAAEMSLSPDTIKTHAGNVYRKLGVHSKQEIVELVCMRE